MAQSWGTHHRAGGGLHTPIDVIAACVPPAIIQDAGGSRPLLAFQLGQDGRLALGEGRHLLQHCGLQCWRVGVQEEKEGEAQRVEGGQVETGP